MASVSGGNDNESVHGVYGKMRALIIYATLCACVFSQVWPLQMQCYHCEESPLEDDCSAPHFIVNCTANIQNACQKEVMVMANGVSYRKACASFTTCLIVSAGYQSFCSPGHMGSVCISCCNTPLCNGPRPPRASIASWLHSPGPPLLQLASIVVATLSAPP
uniref:Ly6/PLAUR domain-containing protein 1-like n=1 Tax=Paramormyrops kingsleyae TaxID=1676925 RepID=A0A3B3RNQ9_9TELE|nr:ly6/PLAUR domain-containing protein 1-like [Paramormyrops kingsleyae]